MLDLTLIDKLAETQTPIKENTAAENNELQKIIEKEKSVNAEIFKEYQENIRASQELRSEINGLIRDGGDLKEITIKAIKCIGLMTGDSLFINQNLKNLEKYK